MSDALTLFGLIERSKPDDISVALAYTTMLRLPVHHPFRLSQQQMLGSARDYLALVYNRDPEWVQDAFEERAKGFD